MMKKIVLGAMLFLSCDNILNAGKYAEKYDHPTFAK